MTHNVSEKDICECGDYRCQHKDGIGECIFNDSDGHLGSPQCKEFRLFQKYEDNT